MADILLIEDNEELAKLISAFLVNAGYTVCHFVSGEEADTYLKTQSAKLLILDLILPGIDGFAVCSAVRQQRDLPILIISARSDKSEKLTGFALGADDYMEKPVDPDLLLAKVKSLIQRTYGFQTEAKRFCSGDLTVDKKGRKVYLGGKELELNVKEYELLLLFLRNPGKTLHKEYLFNSIWGRDSLSENQTLTVHIKMLRSKIETDPRQPKRIQTVWGVGYRYEEI